MAVAEKVACVWNIQLTLTPEEAITLRDVCTHIGGMPEGRRGHTDQIIAALAGVGVRRLPDGTAHGSIIYPDKF